MEDNKNQLTKTEKDIQWCDGFQKGFAKMKKEYDKLRGKIEEYEKAITSLTPGGSEYVNDPEYCAKAVKDLQTEQYYFLAEKIKENKKLVKERELLIEALANLVKSSDSIITYHSDKESNLNGELLKGHKLGNTVSFLSTKRDIKKAKELLNNLQK